LGWESGRGSSLPGVRDFSPEKERELESLEEEKSRDDEAGKSPQGEKKSQEKESFSRGVGRKITRRVY